ncbi:MAG: Uma2 family endonuclease [Candidatus Competibacteraceae bacterium]
MASVRKALWLSPQDYLDGELHSDIKHEYVAGYVYAMTGANEPHNLITGNLFAALHFHLRGKLCRVFINDMKVRTEAAFYYPDIMVCCDPDDTETYYKTHPTLIIEVLSPTTERADTLENVSLIRRWPACKNTCWWLRKSRKLISTDGSLTAGSWRRLARVIKCLCVLWIYSYRLR